MTPDQLARRNAAIRLAWDDPLRRACHNQRLRRPNSKRSSDDAYNAYYREYRQKRRSVS